MTENNEKILKVALIGIGGMGYCHYCCYDSIPGAKIVAVCDVREDMAKEKIQKHAGKKAGNSADTPRVYADLDQMLANETLDMADICTPSYMHADMAVKCLEKGINVLSEKPMTLSEADAARVLAAAKKSGQKIYGGARGAVYVALCIFAQSHRKRQARQAFAAGYEAAFGNSRVELGRLDAQREEERRRRAGSFGA